MRRSSRLLLDEYPLLVLPSLAVAVGLPEAIFLQQLHYWLVKAGKTRDGRDWVYNTYTAWHEQMPFWTERTLQRIVSSLVEKGIVMTTQRYNSSKMDKTNWYAINYEALARLTERGDDHDTLSSSTRQVVAMDDDNLASSSDETETTAETNPERRASPEEWLARYEEQERILRRRR